MRGVIAFTTVAAMLVIACASICPAEIDRAAGAIDPAVVRPANTVASCVFAAGPTAAQFGRAVLTIAPALHDDRKGPRIASTFGGVIACRTTVRRLIHAYLI